MGFQIVSPAPKSIWMPIAPAATVYVGSIVYNSGVGVAVIGASDAAPTTARQPLGVVIGFNYKDDKGYFNTTYNATYMTGIATSNANYTIEKALHDGIGIQKGDKATYAKVALIDPTVWIKGPIFQTAFGTAPTVATVSTLTTGGATGVGCTYAATQGFTSITLQSTTCFRSGLNMGQSRTGTDASATVKTWTVPFSSAIAIGDTAVNVALAVGSRKMWNCDAASTYIDAWAANTNYYPADILAIDLTKAGEEYAIFRFAYVS